MMIRILIFCFLSVTLCFSQNAETAIEIPNVEKSPEAYNFLNYGIGELFKRLSSKIQFLHSQLRLTRVNNFFTSAQDEGLFYNFDVELRDQNGVVVLSTMTIKYQPITGDKELQSYSYNIRAGENYAQSPRSGYLEVNMTEVRESPHIQDLLNFAAEQVIQRAIKNNEISHEDYKISRVYSTYRRDADIGIDYSFNFELTDVNGVKISATCDINYSPLTSSKDLTSLSYSLTENKFSNSHLPNSESEIGNEIQHARRLQEEVRSGQKFYSSSSSFNSNKRKGERKQIMGAGLSFKIGPGSGAKSIVFNSNSVKTQ